MWSRSQLCPSCHMGTLTTLSCSMLLSLWPSPICTPRPNMQQCHFKQTPFFGFSRQTLSLGILTDFDATAAFDRVLAGLSIVTSQWMGLTCIAGIFMYQLLYNMSFNLITGFGSSSITYNNTGNNLSGQGVLQGSSSAGLLFILNSDVSLNTYNRLGCGAYISESQFVSSKTKTC